LVFGVNRLSGFFPARSAVSDSPFLVGRGVERPVPGARSFRSLDFCIHRYVDISRFDMIEK